MFVYKEGKLIESTEVISPDEVIYRLTNTTTGMNIEVKFNPNAYVGQVNTNPYKVFKEVNGVYTIYEEFFQKNKTTKENFEDAILFFEDMIYKELKETPPQVNNPQPNQPPQKKVKIPPVVGDIIRVKDDYGIVTEVEGTKVIVKKMTKEEALRILKNKQNADISLSTQE
jgi:hypothetical protein